MKSVQKIDLGLTGYDELFMNDAERQENRLPRIYDIPISEIDDFPDHPFKVICLIAYRGDEQNIPSVLFTFCPLKNRLHSRIIIIEGACLFRDLVATTQAAIRDQH